MCFSTTASFGASAILAVVGIACLKKVQTSSQLMFALFPILFSIQQFAEGFVWITLTNTTYQHWQSIPIYTFVFFAQVFWTFWVPLSFYFMEQNSIRKKSLFVLVGIGSVISLFHFYNLLFFDVTASINPYHIHYELDFPLRHNLIMQSLYVLVIILPAFVSSIHRGYMLGILLLTSFLVTTIYFKDYIISVWCFFAALVSILVYIILNNLNRESSIRETPPSPIPSKAS